MHITKIRLLNFKCYRGEHILELEPKVYAITASHVDDVESSNWLGKSSLLEAIGWALYGRHHQQNEDAVATYGEKLVEVELVFSDGTSIVRTRNAGKGNLVLLTRTGKGAAKDEAQRIINGLVGLDEGDFVRTCFFEQKKLAELITMRAGERMVVVSDWLRLDPLNECEAFIADKIKDFMTKVDAIDRDIHHHSVVIREFEARPSIITDFNEKSAELVRLKDELESIRDEDKEAERINRVLDDAQRFDEIVAKGIALDKEIKASNLVQMEDSLKQLLRELEIERGVLGDVKREEKSKRSLARGEFDGKCPLIEFTCPAKNQINERTAANKKEHAKTLKLLEVAEAKASDTEEAVDKAASAVDEMRAKKEKLKALAEQAKEYQEAKRKARKLERVDRDSIRRRFDAVQSAVFTLAREVEGLHMLIQSYERSVAQSKEKRTERETIMETVAIHREALILFGKNGAQRRVAEGALATIEASANEMLRRCSIPLELTVQWAREGNGLASACDQCGNPFPSSTRVRNCIRCNAERGAKIVNKLDITLSNRSGAAEDLAGAALQLAASAWLRTDRESGWSVALIDEPFGALDASKRRAFASHLHSMLSGQHGFRQAFVISHSPDTVYTLPGRIEIKSDGKYCKPRVVG